MKLSARNQLKGKITNITEGAVNAIVTVELLGGNTMTATISMAAVKELALAIGKEVYTIVKATSVMIAESKVKLSARNQLAGKIASITEGAVNAIVTLDLGNGHSVVATISMAAVKELGLTEGKEAVAVIKATSVMIGVEA